MKGTFLKKNDTIESVYVVEMVNFGQNFRNSSIIHEVKSLFIKNFIMKMKVKILIINNEYFDFLKGKKFLKERKY